MGRALWLAPLLGARTASAASLSAAELLAELDATSRALVEAQIDGLEWQSRVEALFARADHRDLRSAIALDWKAIELATREAGQVTFPLEPGDLTGGPSDPAFRRKLFCFQRGHAIVPHGHRNLVSAFLVLDGSFRGRHFDRIRDEPDAIVIRPTDDRSFSPGDGAAISDQRNNVHWFTALEDQSRLFNVSVTIPSSRRDPRYVSTDATGRVYLDPEGEALEGGLIRAPRASFSQLRAKYDG